MDCVVLAPFHLRRQRVEPSNDPAKPMVVQLSPSQFERFSALGCVKPLAGHAMLVEAKAEAASYEAEAAKAAAEADALALAQAKAAAPLAAEEAKPRDPPKQRKRNG